MILKYHNGACYSAAVTFLQYTLLHFPFHRLSQPSQLIHTYMKKYTQRKIFDFYFMETFGIAFFMFLSHCSGELTGFEFLLCHYRLQIFSLG